MGKRSVSIYDLAKLAGVSTATVSNVLNHKGSYSEKTRDLVMRIAREQGYVANFAAKSLRESSTKTIAILTPDVSNDFFSNLVLQAEGLLREAGYASYICNTANDKDREDDYILGLLSRQVDGIIYIGGATRGPVAASVDVPVVHIDHDGTSGMRREVYVSNDGWQMQRDMTETLLDHGCSRIVLISVSAQLYSTDDETFGAGYRDALAERFIDVDPDLILEGPHRQTSHIEAAQLIGECLDEGHAFDGVVAMGDRVALGVVNALKDRGIAVGRDVRVIGMDDSIYSRISTPAISTVDRHTDVLAKQGVDALLTMLAGGDPSQTQFVVSHEVVERATTLGE